MLSITPSKLDVFKKHIDGIWNEWFTKEIVTEQIKGIQKTTFKANLGTAIHLILEKGYERYFNKEKNLYIVEVKNKPEPFIFKPTEIIPIIKYVDSHKRAVKEVFIEHKIKVFDYDVLIRMKVDQVFGISATDHKTSDKEPKHDDFENSLQWKIYLLATEAKIFTYNHFQYRRENRGKGNLVIIRREFPLYPYAGMLNDVKGWIQRFIMFCENESLLDFIQYKEPKGVF